MKCGGGIVKPYGEKNCALRGKSTKFGIVIMLGLLNNISYGVRGEGNFVLREVGWLQFPNKLLLLKRML